MREIKFRAWTGNRFIEQEEVKGDGYAPWNSSSLVWQQFTGLLDKNGKEIYEGDIVKSHRGNCEVYFNHGAFVITYPNTRQWKLLNFKNSMDKEIIGNIYENPDLLPTTPPVNGGENR